MMVERQAAIRRELEREGHGLYIALSPKFVPTTESQKKPLAPFLD